MRFPRPALGALVLAIVLAGCTGRGPAPTPTIRPLAITPLHAVLGAHPGSAANPPGSGACPPKFASQQGSCWKEGPEFYFRRIEDQRAIMEQYGDAAKQVWLTELGWDSCADLPVPDGYEYCALTSEGQQAQYLTGAIALARQQWPWLGAFFVWNLNYVATPSIALTDEKYGWSVLRGDWSNRPAFEALKALPK